MPDQFGCDKQDTDGTYLEGPLKGQTSVTVLIDARETKWLKHASKDTGYSFDRLVQIAAENEALEHAKRHSLLP